MKLLLTILLFPFVAFTQCDSLSFELSVTQPGCTGLGNISVVNLQGTAPFTITGAGSLPAGSYTISVTDACGNVRSRQATIASYSFDFTYSIVKTGCASAQATFTATPTGSYTYEVNGTVSTSNIVAFTARNNNVITVTDACGNAIVKNYSPYPGFAPYIDRLEYRLECGWQEIYPVHYGFEAPVTACLYRYPQNTLVECKTSSVAISGSSPSTNFFKLPYGQDYYVIITSACGGRDSAFYQDKTSVDGSQLDPFNFDCNTVSIHSDPLNPLTGEACLYNAATNQLISCKPNDTVTLNPYTGKPFPYGGAVWDNLPYGCYYAWIYDPCADSTVKIDTCVRYPFSVNSTSFAHCDYDRTSVSVNFDPKTKKPYTVNVYYPNGSLAGSQTSTNTNVSQNVPATSTGGTLTVIAQDACGNADTSYVLQETSTIERTITTTQKCPGLSGSSGSGDILIQAINGVPKIISPSVINPSSWVDVFPKFLFPNLPSGTYIIEYQSNHCNPNKIYDTVTIRAYDYPSQQVSLLNCNGGLTFKDSVVGGVSPYTYAFTPNTVTQSGNQFFIPTDTTIKIQVQVTDVCGNSNTVAFTVSPVSCQFLSIVQPRIARIEEKKIKIYPNPSTGRFAISISSKKKQDYSIVIYDVLGVVRYKADHKNIDKKDISATLPKGLYLIMVNGEPFKISIL